MMLRLAAAALGISFSLVSAVLFADSLRSRPAIAAAASVVADPQSWRGSGEMLDRYLSKQPLPGRCDRDGERSLVILEMTRLDLLAADKSVSPLRLEQLRSGALARARHALACAPQDGGSWLYLAMLQQASGERRAEILHSLRLSRRFAPNAAFVLKQRLRFAGRLWSAEINGPRDPLGDLIVDDLTVLAEAGSPSDKKAIVATLGPSIAPLLKRVPSAAALSDAQ